MYYLFLDLWKISIQHSQIKKDIDDFHQMINKIHSMKKLNAPIVSIEIDGMQDYLTGSISIIIDRKKNLIKECCDKYYEIKCKIIQEIYNIKNKEQSYIDGIEVKIAPDTAYINLINFLEKEESTINFLLITDKPIIWDNIDCERIKHAIQKCINP